MKPSPRSRRRSLAKRGERRVAERGWRPSLWWDPSEPLAIAFSFLRLTAICSRIYAAGNICSDEPERTSAGNFSIAYLLLQPRSKIGDTANLSGHELRRRRVVNLRHGMSPSCVDV